MGQQCASLPPSPSPHQPPHQGYAITRKANDALGLHGVASLVYEYVGEVVPGKASAHKSVEQQELLEQLSPQECHHLTEPVPKSAQLPYLPAVTTVVTRILYSIRLSLEGNTKLPWVSSQLQQP